VRLELIIAIVVVIVIYSVFRASSSRFICPKCGASYRTGIFKYIIGPHIMSKRLVKCPDCGYKGFATSVRDGK
jgi:predicted RNA-binding Zn-ribbon protein involved in translation (DUF1610 family)